MLRGCVAKFFEGRDNARFLATEMPMISFKGAHFPKDVILYAVFFYVHYSASYRDLEEIMEERGVNVDYATLNRWVIDYSPLLAAEANFVR
jgi:transposase-like protein